MKQASFMKTLVVILSLLIMYSCGSQKLLNEGSERKVSKADAPKWIDNYKIKNTKSKRAVVGVSKNYAMESSARSDAILQAQKEAITLISSTIAREVKEALASQGADADIVTEGAAKNDVTQSFSEGIFEGELEEYYIEKWEKMSGGTIKRYYKAYALVLFPKNLAEISAQKMLAKQKQKEMNASKAAQIQKAQDLLNNKSLDW